MIFFKNNNLLVICVVLGFLAAVSWLTFFGTRYLLVESNSKLAILTKFIKVLFISFYFKDSRNASSNKSNLLNNNNFLSKIKKI